LTEINIELLGGVITGGGSENEGKNKPLQSRKEPVAVDIFKLARRQLIV